MRVYFRLRVEGASWIPAEGAAIVAPNHKSIWDSFFLAVATRRHLRFMGKSELFEGRFGRTLVRLGAFPVRRGQSDAEALETARTILRQGGLLSLFPEGTRFRDPDRLGEPRRGAARLALETGAPLIPAAITGTERLFVGPLPKPRRVQVAFAEPISVQGLAATPEVASAADLRAAVARGQRRVHATASAARRDRGGTGRGRAGGVCGPAPNARAARGEEGRWPDPEARGRRRPRRSRRGCGSRAAGRPLAERPRRSTAQADPAQPPWPVCSSADPQAVATSERAPPRSRCSQR